MELTSEEFTSQKSDSEDSDLIGTSRKRKGITLGQVSVNQGAQISPSTSRGRKKRLKQGPSPDKKLGQPISLPDDVFTCPPERKKLTKVTWRCENIRRKAAGLPELPSLSPPPTALELDPTYYDPYETSSDEDKILPIPTKDKDVAKRIHSSGVKGKEVDEMEISFGANEVEADSTDEEYDSDFIDDSGDVSMNGVALPVRFSTYAAQPFDDYVEDFIERLTHTLLGIEAPRSPEIYKFAFDKITDEPKQLARSEFTCANWAIEFVRALKAYPRLKLTELRPQERDKTHRCDACNHPRWVRYAIQFMGQPYKLDPGHEFLRALPPPRNQEFHDAEGVLLAPRAFTWKLGKKCKDNATLNHRLMHLPHELKVKIEAHLNDARHLPSQRPKSLNSTPEDMEKAARIYNRMLAQGLVFQWVTWYKNVLEAARKFKNERNVGTEPKEVHKMPIDEDDVIEESDESSGIEDGK